MGDPLRVRVAEPLRRYGPGFAAELARLGYTAGSASVQMLTVAHLSRWLAVEGLEAAGLTPAVAERFLADRRAAGYTRHLSPQALALLLGYLRRLGVVPLPPLAEPGTAAEVLLGRYRAYLAGERGLAPSTVSHYVAEARLFLDRAAGADLGGLADLAAAGVSGFVAAECRRRGTGSAKMLVTALRSLLRFLFADGLLAADLAAAVPAVAGWRGAGLVTALPAGHVAALLACCDRETPAGRRDFAVLMLLARLGLRACEVAALELDDISWRAGEIVIRGKGRRDERMPLPADVGEALAGYLRGGRPAGQARGRCSCGPWPRLARCQPMRSRRWSAAPAAGPGWPRPARTGCGIPRLSRCCGPGRRWPRSGRCCGTAARRRPRSTPRWIMPRWPRSRGRGREAGRERAARRAGGLPGPAPQPGLQAGAARPAAGRVRRLRRAGRRADGHHRTGPGLGNRARRCRPGLVAATAGRHPPVRAVPRRGHPRDRGAAGRAAARPCIPPGGAVSVSGGRDRRAHGRGRGDPLAAAGGHLPDPHRAAGRYRDAGRRGDPPRPARHRPAGRAADHPAVQVRQVPPAAAARHHHGGPGQPRRPAGPAPSPSGHPGVLPLADRDPADLQKRPPHLPPADPAGRTAAAFAGLRRGSTTCVIPSRSPPC